MANSKDFRDLSPAGVLHRAALSACARKLLLYVACLGEVMCYTEEAPGPLQTVKCVQEKGSGSQQGRPGTGNGANGLGVRGEGMGGVPRMMCTCMCVFVCCVISRLTSHALSLPSNKTSRLCVTVCFFVHPSCHISGIESRRCCFCITTEIGQQLIKTYIRELFNAQAKLMCLFLFFH